MTSSRRQADAPVTHGATGVPLGSAPPVAATPDAASPVTGQRILLTRATEDANRWAERLEACGATAVVRPCIDAEPIDSAPLRADLRAAAAGADWWVFTSRRGVEAFVRLAGDAAAHGHAKIAVVGETTAHAASKALGRPATVIGAAGTAESLAAAMLDAGVTGQQIMLALAANAGRVLEDALTDAGADCRRFDVYRTVPAPQAAERTPLSSLRVDAVWLASPSSVQGFLNRFELDEANGAKLVAIGPSTARAMREHGLAVHAVAARPSFEGLLEAMTP